MAADHSSEPPHKIVEGRITMNTLVNGGVVLVLVGTALNVGAYQERLAQTVVEVQRLKVEVQALRDAQIRTDTNVTTILGGIARIEARLDGKEQKK